MPVFQIGLEDGRSLRIEADDQDAALAGAQHFMETEKTKAPSGVAAGFAKGLSDEIQGVGETAKQFAGIDNSRTNTAADRIAPHNYHADQVVPEGGHWYDPTTYNYKAIPQALAEQAPGIATSLIAARTAAKLLGPKAGLVAGVGSMLLPTLGRSAKEDAAIRTGNPNAEPETQDKARAVATGLAQSIPAAVGIGRFLPGAGAAAKSTAQATGRALTTAATEGASAGAQDAIQQIGSTIGTDGGVQFDPNRAMSQAVTGTVGGGLLAAPGAASKAVRNAKTDQFAGDNQTATEAVANRIKTAADGAKLNTKGGFQAVKTVDGDIKSELNSAVKDIGGRQALPEDADSALRRAGEGRELTNADFDSISKAVGNDPAGDRVKDLARQAHVVAMLKRQGDFDNQAEKFTGGVLHQAAQQVRALNKPLGAAATTGAVLATGAAPSLFAYSPHTLAGLTALAGGLRLVDAVTGSRSPTQRLVDRFGGTDTPHRADILPTPQPVSPDLSQGPWGPRPLPNVSVPQFDPAAARAKAEAPQADADWKVMREQADSENAYKDLLWKLQRSQADSENAAVDARNTQAARHDALDMRVNQAQAVSENKARDMAAAALLKQSIADAKVNRAQADSENKALDANFRANRQQADSENKASDILGRMLRAQADSENKTFNADFRVNQDQAASENRDRTRALAASALSKATAPTAPDPMLLPSDITKRARTVVKAASMVQKLRLANEKQNAIEQAAAEPPVISKINKKLNGKVQTEQAEATYSPIAEEKQWRNSLSDEDVATKELSSYRPDVQEKYFDNVVNTRAAKRDLLEAFAENASSNDATLAGALYRQLDHISRRATARAAIAHYIAQMSPEGAAALRAKFTPAKLKELWAKE